MSADQSKRQAPARRASARSTSTASRKRKRPRAARATAKATRIEILKAAAGAFRRLGYHGASVEEIATSLKMQKGNLYYYFRTKEEILFACHQYSLDRLMEVLEKVETDDRPPDQKLRELIVAFVHIILDDLCGTALFLDLEALTPAHQRQAIARRDEFDRGLRRVIQQGVDWGTFAPHVEPKLLSFAVLGAVNWIPRWYNPEGPRSSSEIATQFAQFLVDGLRSYN
ncbi:MAG: TetR/AcrR family transcriptional regulator [Vicinamibacterales bacterium]